MVFIIVLLFKHRLVGASHALHHLLGTGITDICEHMSPAPGYRTAGGKERL